MTYTGYKFSTGNSTVAKLPKGSTLQVNGQGQLVVTSVAQVSFKPGDRIRAPKHGLGTIVRPSTRFGTISGFNPSSQYLYVADKDPVVRAVAKGDVQSA